MSGLLRKPDSFPLDVARIHSPIAFAKSLHFAIIIKTIHIPTIFYVNIPFSKRVKSVFCLLFFSSLKHMYNIQIMW